MGRTGRLSPGSQVRSSADLALLPRPGSVRRREPGGCGRPHLTRLSPEETTLPTAPTILPTQIPEGRAPGLRYRLEGELVPVLHMALDGQVPVYFEHHVLLWKYPNMQVGLHPLKKGLKRRVFG